MKKKKNSKYSINLTINFLMILLALGFSDLHSLNNKKYGSYSAPFFVKSDKGAHMQKKKPKVPKEEAELKSIEEKLDHFEAMLDQIEDVVDRIDKKIESPRKNKPETENPPPASEN